MEGMESLSIFARRVIQVREQRGWTQQQLAERAGISYQTIWRLERGVHREPGIFVAARIARALHTSLDFLCGVYDDSELGPAVLGEHGDAVTQDGSTVPFTDNSAPIMAHAVKE